MWVGVIDSVTVDMPVLVRVGNGIKVRPGAGVEVNTRGATGVFVGFSRVFTAGLLWRGADSGEHAPKIRIRNNIVTTQVFNETKGGQ